MDDFTRQPADIIHPMSKSMHQRMCEYISTHSSMALALIIVLVVIVIGMYVYYHGLLSFGPYVKHSRKSSSDDDSDDDSDTDRLIKHITGGNQ